MKYKTIVIDPPWNIPLKMSLPHGDIEQPYQTMTNQQIRDFPINDYCDDNCDLFIWTTQSQLKFTFELSELWGFKYHCLMVWDKQDGLNVWGFRRTTEFIVYCYKGKTNRDFTKKNLPVLFSEHRKGHSQKPRKFYDLILKNTAEPRIDIFSRKKHIGFDSWGNQAEEPITLEAFIE